MCGAGFGECCFHVSFAGEGDAMVGSGNSFVGHGDWALLRGRALVGEGGLGGCARGIFRSEINGDSSCGWWDE